MARPEFPAYARIVASDYADQPDYGTLTSDLPGLPTQRSRWSSPIVTRTVTVLVMNRNDRTAFDTWMREDLRGGSGWFQFLDPVGHVQRLGRIVDGTVSWTSPGIVWRGQCKIESING